MSSVRTPENPCAREFARMRIAARTTSLGKGSPTATA